MHAQDRLVDPAALRDAVTLDGPLTPVPGVRYVLGVDLGFRHDRSVVSICHAEPVEDRPPARRVVLDRMIVFEGTRADEVRLRDVEMAVVQAWEEYGRPRIRLDIWQAVGLKQRIEARGVRIEEFTFSPQNNARLAGTLDMLFRDRLLALPPDEELLSELARIRLRETAVGTLRIDHSSGEHDDRAIALSLVATALVEDGIPRPATIASALGLRIPGVREAQLPSIGFGWRRSTGSTANRRTGHRPS